MEIEWDEGKAKRNAAKHGVTFEEAASALMDPNAIVGPDEGHSIDEERYRTVAMSFVFQVLVVITTERDGDVIRIISARKANRYEKSQYQEAARRYDRGG